MGRQPAAVVAKTERSFQGHARGGAAFAAETPKSISIAHLRMLRPYKATMVGRCLCETSSGQLASWSVRHRHGLLDEGHELSWQVDEPADPGQLVFIAAIVAEVVRIVAESVRLTSTLVRLVCAVSRSDERVSRIATS